MSAIIGDGSPIAGAAAARCDHRHHGGAMWQTVTWVAGPSTSSFLIPWLRPTKLQSRTELVLKSTVNQGSGYRSSPLRFHAIPDIRPTRCPDALVLRSVLLIIRPDVVTLPPSQSTLCLPAHRAFGPTCLFGTVWRRRPPLAQRSGVPPLSVVLLDHPSITVRRGPSSVAYLRSGPRQLEACSSTAISYDSELLAIRRARPPSSSPESKNGTNTMFAIHTAASCLFGPSRRVLHAAGARLAARHRAISVTTRKSPNALYRSCHTNKLDTTPARTEPPSPDKSTFAATTQDGNDTDTDEEEAEVQRLGLEILSVSSGSVVSDEEDMNKGEEDGAEEEHDQKQQGLTSAGVRASSVLHCGHLEEGGWEEEVKLSPHPATDDINADTANNNEEATIARMRLCRSRVGDAEEKTGGGVRPVSPAKTLARPPSPVKPSAHKSPFGAPHPTAQTPRVFGRKSIPRSEVEEPVVREEANDGVAQMEVDAEGYTPVYEDLVANHEASNSDPPTRATRPLTTFMTPQALRTGFGGPVGGVVGAVGGALVPRYWLGGGAQRVEESSWKVRNLLTTNTHVQAPGAWVRAANNATNPFRNGGSNVPSTPARRPPLSDTEHRAISERRRRGDTRDVVCEKGVGSGLRRANEDGVVGDASVNAIVLGGEEKEREEDPHRMLEDLRETVEGLKRRRETVADQPQASGPTMTSEGESVYQNQSQPPESEPEKQAMVQEPAPVFTKPACRSRKPTAEKIDKELILAVPSTAMSHPQLPTLTPAVEDEQEQEQDQGEMPPPSFQHPSGLSVARVKLPLSLRAMQNRPAYPLRRRSLVARARPPVPATEPEKRRGRTTAKPAASSAPERKRTHGQLGLVTVAQPKRRARSAKPKAIKEEEAGPVLQEPAGVGRRRLRQAVRILQHRSRVRGARVRCLVAPAAAEADEKENTSDEESEEMAVVKVRVSRSRKVKEEEVKVDGSAEENEGPHEDLSAKMETHAMVVSHRRLRFYRFLAPSASPEYHSPRSTRTLCTSSAPGSPPRLPPLQRFTDLRLKPAPIWQQECTQGSPSRATSSSPSRASCPSSAPTPPPLQTSMCHAPRTRRSPSPHAPVVSHRSIPSPRPTFILYAMPFHSLTAAMHNMPCGGFPSPAPTVFAAIVTGLRASSRRTTRRRYAPHFHQSSHSALRISDQCGWDHDSPRRDETNAYGDNGREAAGSSSHRRRAAFAAMTPLWTSP
ncbi:hypothetical protein B0H12DRAFT_1238403 [Mycena haematopus]|nr:hypothetical protein B0H12DRAFT_1238403 [Mycena haematopus]